VLRELRTRHSGGATRALEPMSGVSGIAVASRYIEGGRMRFLEYVNLAALNGVECAMRFWNVYADLNPTERLRASLDDIAWAANVKPHELMSAVVSTAMQHSIDVGNLVAASMHPDIVRQAAKSAKRIGGQFADIAFKDRLLLLQASGLAPMPKGQSTNVHVHATASAAAEAAAASKSESSVPTFADDMYAIEGATVRGQQALPPARPRTLLEDEITQQELDAINATDARDIVAVPRG
jgi:hypothetical protein